MARAPLAAVNVEKFGINLEPSPDGAIVHFQRDDPEAGPIVRYTISKRVSRPPDASSSPLHLIFPDSSSTTIAEIPEEVSAALTILSLGGTLSIENLGRS